MSLLTISEVSKLVSKSQRTIYRQIDKGILTMSKNFKGQKCIEVSELMRVYPDIKIKDVSIMSKDKSLTTPKSVKEIKTENDLNLQFKIEQLELELKFKEDIIKEKENQINILNKSLDLLEYKNDKKEEKLLDKKGFWGKLFKK